MKILIIGNGGREHALAWKAAQSPLVTEVWVAPGNAGTAREAKVHNIGIAATAIDKLLQFAQTTPIDLTIVGPEAPLAAGVVDLFREHHIPCFGPTQAAAQLESSKAFCKDFLARHHIPTARYQTFTEASAALAYVQTHSFPLVIKADGLAAGKGVVIAQTLAEANEAIHGMLSQNTFGAAGQRIVIEEFLSGEEASFIVIADGKTVLPFASSQDHKARDNHDRGPNTGGMGAYSPAPVVTPEVEQRIMNEVIYPTLNGMAAEGRPYTGFLYAGVMITPDGTPKVLEFNCRLGDPETEPLLMRLQSDLVAVCQAALAKQLHETKLEWDPRVALGVVMAAAGYPYEYPTGEVIHLPSELNANCKIFHAGTLEQNGKIKTQGGRVLCVTALGETTQAAQQQAYATVNQIHWDHMYYRTDIGYRAIAREQHEQRRPSHSL